MNQRVKTGPRIESPRASIWTAGIPAEESAAGIRQ